MQLFKILLGLFTGLLAVSAQQTSDLKFCKTDLKGYLFEDSIIERCYQLVYKLEDRLSWSDARDYCQVNGGRMLNIESPEKQDRLEELLSSPNNPHKPNRLTYNPLESMNSTWAGYDPDVWLGATRDSDGNTWRFDQFSTSRTVDTMIVQWFNYGTDPVLLARQQTKSNRYNLDTCLIMRFEYEPWNRTVNDKIVVQYNTSYPWYQQQLCSSDTGRKHSYICEYIGYEYRQTPPTSNWIIVIGVLGVFVGCGFLACTMYCLWDKIHTSYNVLQV